MEAEKLYRKYTVDDYEKWEGDWELHDGVPVQLYPPHPEEMTGFKPGVQMSPSPIAPHQIVVANVARHLGNLLEANAACDCLVVSELDWHVSDICVVRPDISVICPPIESRYIEQPPRLIVEALSHSTAKRDLDWKRNLYERLGVGVYVIIDVERREVEALRYEERGYRSTSLNDLELDGDCRISLEVQRFWRGLIER